MTPTLWIAIGAVVAALIVREVKISDFRQAWIDGLRADISEYISKAYEWIDLYLAFNEESEQEKKAQLAPQLDRVKYDCFHVLRRIELRFKPNDGHANTLIDELGNLLNPQKIPPPNSQWQWTKLADAAVSRARALLKAEWEITKNPLRKLLSLWRAP